MPEMGLAHAPDGEQAHAPGHPAPLPRPAALCLLGFDFGTRFVGVAIGNTLTAEARPLAVIEHRSNEQLFSAIARLLVDWEPAGLIVGVPRHPDGTAHEMTARAERFARQLEGRFGRNVYRVDERYSSVEADGLARAEALARPARSPSRNDAQAASVILRQYLAAIKEGAHVDPA
jgi:putative Holliday junction resolvase